MDWAHIVETFTEAVNAEFYLPVLRQLRETVRKKLPGIWRKHGWFFHHNHVLAHTTLSTPQILADNSGFTVTLRPWSPTPKHIPVPEIETYDKRKSTWISCWKTVTIPLKLTIFIQNRKLHAENTGNVVGIVLTYEANISRVIWFNKIYMVPPVFNLIGWTSAVTDFVPSFPQIFYSPVWN